MTFLQRSIILVAPRLLRSLLRSSSHLLVAQISPLGRAQQLCGVSPTGTPDSVVLRSRGARSNTRLGCGSVRKIGPVLTWGRGGTPPSTRRSSASPRGVPGSGPGPPGGPPHPPRGVGGVASGVLSDAGGTPPSPRGGGGGAKRTPKWGVRGGCKKCEIYLPKKRKLIVRLFGRTFCAKRGGSKNPPENTPEKVAQLFAHQFREIAPPGFFERISLCFALCPKQKPSTRGGGLHDPPTPQNPGFGPPRGGYPPLPRNCEFCNFAHARAQFCARGVHNLCTHPTPPGGRDPGPT